MVERERLQDKVQFLGSVPHKDVPSVLNRGHIFLNCSLTESFCIALLEVACCGLLPVSTNVGGIPEVLPLPEMVLLADPDVDSLVAQLKVAILRIQNEQLFNTNINHRRQHEFHRRVSEMYSWDRVANETIQLYDHIMQQDNKKQLWDRLQRYNSVGSIIGLFAYFLIITLEFWLSFVEWWQPKESIDVVPDLPHYKDTIRINKEDTAVDDDETKNKLLRKNK